MIYRKNNIFDKVKNDYDIPVESVAEVCDVDIGKIKKNVFAEIHGKPKKTYYKKRVFIIIAAALITVGAGGLIIANGSKPVPKTPNQLTSDEYREWIQRSKMPRVLNVPMPSDEEKAVIDKVQDEYVDLYRNALQGYSETLDSENAQFKAEEDVIKSLFEKASFISEKYGYGSFNENSDIAEMIKTCCKAAENEKITLEEKITLKFFVRQTYEFVETGDENFSKYVKEKMELTFIPYISIYTAYSYEKDKYYIHNDEISESESS